MRLTRMQAGALRRLTEGKCRWIHPVTLRSLVRRNLVGRNILGEVVILEKGERELALYQQKQGRK